MDSVKTDNEGELTSTMDNVISVPSKDEKSDTSSDATPTSSTDANIRPSASRIALDDPISSTSSDSLDQGKQKMEKRESASVDVHRVSTDNEADLLDISNITNNEKITEDVEDLVHDLESLLGESTDSFNITSNSKLKTESSKGTGSGVSSFDTASPKNSAVDDVLQELEELAGNVITDDPPISTEQNKETESDKALPVASTNERRPDVDTETNNSIVNDVSAIDNSSSVDDTLASGSSDIVTNSEVVSNEDTVQINTDNNEIDVKEPENENTELETSSSGDNLDQQDTPCIQDQDISHSEPKDVELETAPLKSPSDVETELSEGLSSKTEEVVTSSDSEPKEEACGLDGKSHITGSDESKPNEMTPALVGKSSTSCSEEAKVETESMEITCALVEKSSTACSKNTENESDRVISNEICQQDEDKASQDIANRIDDVKTNETVDPSKENEELSSINAVDCEGKVDVSIVDTKEASSSLVNEVKPVNIESVNVESVESLSKEIGSIDNTTTGLSEFPLEKEIVSEIVKEESKHVESDNTNSSLLTSTVAGVEIGEEVADHKSVDDLFDGDKNRTITTEVGTPEKQKTSDTNDSTSNENLNETLEVHEKLNDAQHSKTDDVINNTDVCMENETELDSAIGIPILIDETPPNQVDHNNTENGCDIKKNPEVLLPEEVVNDLIKPPSGKSTLEGMEDSLIMECDVPNSIIGAEILLEKSSPNSEVSKNISEVDQALHESREKEHMLTKVFPPSETISFEQKESAEVTENVTKEVIEAIPESQFSPSATENILEETQQERNQTTIASADISSIPCAENEGLLKISPEISVTKEIVESHSVSEEANEIKFPTSVPHEGKEIISEASDEQSVKLADIPDLAEDSTSKDSNKEFCEMKEIVPENFKEEINECTESQVDMTQISGKVEEPNAGKVTDESLELLESGNENINSIEVVAKQPLNCPQISKDLNADDELSVVSANKQKIIDSSSDVVSDVEKELLISKEEEQNEKSEFSMSQVVENSAINEPEITRTPSEMSEEDVVPSLVLELDDNMDDSKEDEQKFNKDEHDECAPDSKESETQDNIDRIAEVAKESNAERSGKEAPTVNEVTLEVNENKQEFAQINDSKESCLQPDPEILANTIGITSPSKQMEEDTGELAEDSIQQFDSSKEEAAEIPNETSVSSHLEVSEIDSEKAPPPEDSNQIELVVQDETALAVASLEDIEMTRDTPLLTEKEKRDMEALRQAVESITDVDENVQAVNDEEQNNLLVSVAAEDSASSDITENVLEVTSIPINVGNSEPLKAPENRPDVGIVVDAKILEDNESDMRAANQSDDTSKEIDETLKTDKHVKGGEEIEGAVSKTTDGEKETTSSAIKVNEAQVTTDGDSAQVQKISTKSSEIPSTDPRNRNETGVASSEDVEEVDESEIPTKTSELSEDVDVHDENDTEESQAREVKTSEAVEDIDAVNEEVLPDSSMSVSDNEAIDTKEGKSKSKRHKKSSDNKLEELNINIDVPDKEKAYSPKITIKPIKVPDEEVSTTSNSEAESCKGSLKMTITKQSDKMHSILKVCDVEQSPEPAQDAEEPLPKLKIKSKPGEQSAAKMSTRSTRQAHQTVNVTQRSSSPRITIKPVVKPEILSPLKIKIGLKTDESTKKHSPKLNIKVIPKPEDEPKEMTQSPRKVLIKPIVKPPEEEEQAPKITIKPIPKPDMEKEASASPKLNIKPIKKPEEDENDAEKTSPKITIKPIVKPPEPDVHSEEVEDETKKRIVLKINKGNIPPKESRKREHSAEDDKAEKLAKITVKFSKEGGHPHIVQQPDENPQKRPHEELNHLEKSKKQKVECEPSGLMRIKQKDPVDPYLENKKSNPSPEPMLENSENLKAKAQMSDNPGHGSRGKHRDSGTNSPIDAKRAKLKEIRQKDVPDMKNLETDVNVAHSPLDTTEDGVSVPQVTPQISTPLLMPIFSPEIFVSNTDSASSTPNTPIPKKKRGRPRKIRPEEQLNISTDTPPPKEVQTPPTAAAGSGRPKRSCRGQSALDTLGLKPRKPRGSRGGGRGGGRAASGETRAILMKPEKDAKLSQARLKLFQKAIAEAGTVNIVSIGTGDDKSVDIEDVLPQSQVEKKLIDVGGNYGGIILKPGGIGIKGGALFGKHVAGQSGVIGIGKGEDIKNPNIKANLVYLHPSTSTEVGVPSSSTSPPQNTPEAMLVSDPVPHDASLPKSFSAGGDSSLLVPESSTTIHSAVSSTTGPSEIVMVDEETRMSADISSRAQTPAKQVVPMDIVEESQSSVQSTATTESGKASSSRTSKAPRLEVQEPEGSVISADQLAEYYWNGNGPFMLQEQVAQFLGIKSFKRKYPGIKRRMLEMQERDFIRESGIVSEHMCDLGLTAVNSADILDIMYSDFQDKYEEYCKHQRDRQTKELINKQRALSLAASQEKNKADLTENAKQSAAQWNANFNKARREQRRACMDLQTYTVHYPKGRMKKFSKIKMGNYPVSLVPGQFTDYYKDFTPTEINNLPLTTMCYEPIDYIRPEESSDSDSNGSDSDSDSSSSSSDSDSSSSSGVEDCKLCKHSPKKITTPTISK